MRLLGAVLAGGQSRRFGRDKAREIVAGESMLHHAVRALQSVTEEVVVISPYRPDAPQGIEVLPDAQPGHGPLGGLHTALLEAAARQMDAVLLLACDLPLVGEQILEAVVAHTENCAAVAPKRREGVEPLCAVYSSTALLLVAQRLNGPDLSMHSLFRALDGRELDLSALGLDEGAAFLNVNTPEDLVRAESLMDRRGPA